ncbi:HAD-like protein [Durotheca rogersii]|uniref:HAD-like protein n=1 Tax=Durotheca rogersii TaxID=419775 RepID=UPI002220ABD7|nr:HAD-like protein [Durotheca rogersii]KAI5865442.1 HAD-like protein [Durotheca rogersii]
MSARDWSYPAYSGPAANGPVSPQDLQALQTSIPPVDPSTGGLPSQNPPPTSTLASNANPGTDTVLNPPGASQLPSPPVKPESPARSNSNSNQPSTAKSSQPAREKRIRRVPPSEASGGIPDPTPEYLLQASLPPARLALPRKILVVIDLNGTLLFRPNRRKQPTAFVKRPYAREFLSYCIDTFAVAIWSSARPSNVSQMCQQLMTPEYRERVVAVWGRDRFNLSELDYNARVQCYKRLSILWGDPAVAESHPQAATGGRWSQRDTVLVDDSLEKGRSEPHNLICIPEFSGNDDDGGDNNAPDTILPQVHDYINECSFQSDISAFMYSQPFAPVPGWVLGSPAT